MISHKEINPWAKWHFDVSEASKRNVLVSGGNNSGKTRMAMAHADILQRCGWIVICADPSGAWKQGPLKEVVTLREGQTNIMKIYDSVVFDTSELYLNSQVEFIETLSQYLWEWKTKTNNQTPVMLILEESQIFAKSLKADKVKNLARLLLVGRNKQIRCTMITPRLASIGTEAIATSGQRYFGFSNETNNSRKLKSMYGKEWSEIAKSLNVGEFVFINSNKPPQLIRVPLFTPDTVPTETTTKTQDITIKEMVALSIASVPLLAFIWVVLSLFSFFY